MTATPEQQVTEPSTVEADSHRLAALRAGARRLLEVQRSRIRIIEATLSEQAATLLELASRQEIAARETQNELTEERDQLAREQQSLIEARGQTEALLEAERARLAQKHNETQQEAERLLAEAREALQEALEQRTALQAQLAESQKSLEERTAELEAARESQQAAADSDDVQSLMSEIERLESDRNALKEQLASAVEAGAENADEETAVIRQRFESAVKELRELKQRNDELMAENKRLADRPANLTDASVGVPTDGFDWETQKLALMKQMEEDFDESEEGQAANKLTVEGAIRITDEVVAEKDQEIEELKKLLSDQSSSLGDVAVGAAAIADMLDQDELIRDERENLRRQQDEWREKLRQAEVEISVERAKFARERIELDEQIRSFEEQKASLNGEAADPEGKSPRGNWLSRLGLKDDT